MSDADRGHSVRLDESPLRHLEQTASRGLWMFCAMSDADRGHSGRLDEEPPVQNNFRQFNARAAMAAAHQRAHIQVAPGEVYISLANGADIRAAIAVVNPDFAIFSHACLSSPVYFTLEFRL
ncbi:hypothetical protein RRG08_002787 [Elysia crispata]|uniref:Uncharacterized protein n=1 Tax=Elysia crispata TaxID=231223 RepID=A0AAE0XTX7_9GAST|nr:hypothetical protein RRG08_002787 [Elysia crispata]